MAAIGTDAPALAPRPRLLGRTQSQNAQSKASVKRFDLQKQPNATRRAPEAHRVPPSRTAKDAEAEDSDEDEYLHGADQHEGLAQFINRSRDYEPARCPRTSCGITCARPGPRPPTTPPGSPRRPMDHFFASLINEAGEAAALRGDAAGRRARASKRTADVMASAAAAVAGRGEGRRAARGAQLASHGVHNTTTSRRRRPSRSRASRAAGI